MQGLHTDIVISQDLERNEGNCTLRDKICLTEPKGSCNKEENQRSLLELPNLLAR